MVDRRVEGAIMKHLLLLALLLGSTYGIALEDLKGPLGNKAISVPEATVVPYPVYQFMSAVEGVTDYKVSGDLQGISMSSEGWLYLTEPLAWSDKNTHTLQIEALAGDDTVDGPYDIVLTVLDINNHEPTFEKDVYVGELMEHMPAGTPLVQVAASDPDDPESVHSALWYSIIREIPSTPEGALFQIDPQSGEISTTEAGARLLQAQPVLRYGVDEIRGNREVLEKKFDNYCLPVNDIPYDKNPFFTCVLRRESKALEQRADADYTLIVKAADMGGADNALSSTTRVNVFVRQNSWVNPGPLRIKENLKVANPIAKVESNDPNAIYSLVQKERGNFPFSINAVGEIFVTEELDREEKDMYILVVYAKDEQGVDVDKPMEIHVTVMDENDNAPVCDAAELEVQENEVVGSVVGTLSVHDADDENTVNTLLTYKLLSQLPESEAMFSVDTNTGDIKVTKGGFRRSVISQYSLTVSVSDGGLPVNTVECKVTVKVIDINNELPIFESNDYGTVSASETAEPGHVLLKVMANDADDPGSGSSKVVYSIAEGDPESVFRIASDDSTGQGILSVAKPLNYEETSSYTLKIYARNPEPLVAGMEYGAESTTVVVVNIVDVDEAPEFGEDILSVSVPENLTVGATVLTVKAQDPEGKEITFKLEGDERGWLEIDSATGELKTKAALDYETVQDLTVKVIVSEKDNPDMQAEKEVYIRLTDVNDNVPKLVTQNTFICVQDHKKPVLLEAMDADAEPFGAPFTFSLGVKNQRSPNWEVKSNNGSATSALLILKKVPPAEQIFGVPINIIDSAGMGVTHTFQVHVCNCTKLQGSCYIQPEALAGVLSIEVTVVILAGVLVFAIIIMVIAVKKSKKKSKQNKNEGEEVFLSKNYN